MNDAFRGGKIILTGATSGIGRALALRLAAGSTLLALIGRNVAVLDQVVAESLAAGADTVTGRAFDLANTAGIEELVGEIVAEWNAAPDMVIHCAGVGYVGRVEDVPLREVEQCLAVNFTAAVALAHAVLPQMRKRKSGRLVFFSSGTAWYGVPGETAYAASKAAIERFAEGLAIELDGSGVSVTVVSPGIAETPMLRSPRIFGDQVLAGRPAAAPSPESVAALIADKLGSSSAGRIEGALRPRLIRHLAYWTPALLRSILGRQLHSKRT